MGSNKNFVRGRISYISRKSYNEYIKKYPESTVTYKQFIQILKQSNSLITHYVINNELGFKMPYNLGYIAVTKFKQKDSYVVTDWINTRKQGRFVPLTNFHSIGWMFKIKLFRNHRIKPLKVYYMYAHRLLKRSLAAHIKAGNQAYLALDDSYFNKRFSISRILKNNID